MAHCMFISMSSTDFIWYIFNAVCDKLIFLKIYFGHHIPWQPWLPHKCHSETWLNWKHYILFHHCLHKLFKVQTLSNTDYKVSVSINTEFLTRVQQNWAHTCLVNTRATYLRCHGSCRFLSFLVVSQPTWGLSVHSLKVWSWRFFVTFRTLPTSENVLWVEL